MKKHDGRKSVKTGKSSRIVCRGRDSKREKGGPRERNRILNAAEMGKIFRGTSRREVLTRRN